MPYVMSPESEALCPAARASLRARALARSAMFLAGIALLAGAASAQGPAPSPANPGVAAGHEAHGGHGAHGSASPAADSPYRALSAGTCQETTIACARAATPYFGRDGSLWLAWSAGGAVSVARSNDLGKSFDAPVQIAMHPGTLDTGPDARPQIIGDAQGNLVVAYGFFRDRRWNAQVNVSTSRDHGQSFSDPKPVSADASSQRFPTLAVDGTGRILLTWIDKRLVARDAKAGQKRAGGSIAMAWSTDGGASFSGEAISYEDSCECCRIAVAINGSGEPVLVFRGIYPGSVRDHVLLESSSTGPAWVAHRVATDDWKTDACPHHGPALAISGAGTYHVAWFTQGSVRQGTFYARSTDRGQQFSAPRPVGKPDTQPGRAALLARGEHVWLAWKEFDGKTVRVMVQDSVDDGRTWSAPRMIAQAVGYTDHPLLVASGDKVFLSWLTASAGYRLIPLESSR